jgi:hypothetical protein
VTWRWTGEDVVEIDFSTVTYDSIPAIILNTAGAGERVSLAHSSAAEGIR